MVNRVAPDQSTCIRSLVMAAVVRVALGAARVVVRKDRRMRLLVAEAVVRVARLVVDQAPRMRLLAGVAARAVVQRHCRPPG